MGSVSYMTADRVHLFVLSPPFSGSTVLWRVLNTSPNVTSLPHVRGEGQFIPSVKHMMRDDPWNPGKSLDWNFIRDQWSRLWDPGRAIRLEKSPPNILRAPEIERHFPNSHFVAMMRNPYAFCEGICRRLSVDMRFGAETWLSHARAQMRNRQTLERILFFTYEEFTDQTERVRARLLDFLPALQSLDIGGTYFAKSILGRGERPIQNFNGLKIKELSDDDRRAIRAVLQQRRDVLDFFGYPLDCEESGPDRNAGEAQNRTGVRLGPERGRGTPREL